MTKDILNLHRQRYTPEQISEMSRKVVVRFLTGAGMLYNIAECALLDTVDYIEKHNTPKGLWKRWIKKAYMLSRHDSVDKFAKEHLLKGYDLWLDMTDNAQEELKNPLQTMKLTMSNIVLKHTDKYPALKTEVLHTLHLYEFCVNFYNVMFDSLKLQEGLDFEKPYRKMKQYDVYLAIRAAAQELCEDIHDYVSQTKEMEQCDHVIANIISREDFMNKIAHKALVDNGNYNKEIKDFESNGKTEL